MDADELLSLELGIEALTAMELHEDSRLMVAIQQEWAVIQSNLLVCDVQVHSPSWYRLTVCLERCPILEAYFTHRSKLWDLTLQVCDSQTMRFFD